MANTTFYQYLKEAFRFRVRNAQNSAVTPDTHFTYPGLPWNLSYKHIFEYARKLLPAVYKDIGNFPNTEEGNLSLAKTILEKLDRHQDAQLEKQFRNDSITAEEEQFFAQAQAESAQAAQQQAEAGLSSTSGGGGMPFGAPTAGGGFSAGSFRVIHNVPQTEKPDIAIANSSGHVAEAGDSSKLVKANSSAYVTEKGDPSKLVTANSSGTVKEAPPSKIFTTKGGTIKEQPIHFSSGFSSLRSNLGSRLGIGINKGLNRAISSLNNFGAGGGTGSGSIFGRFGRGGGRGFFGRGGNKEGSITGKVKGRGKLIYIGGILVFMVLTGMLTAMSPSNSSSTGTSSPGTPPSGIPPTGVIGLDYALPLKDPSVSPMDIKNEVLATFSGAKIAYWNTIVQKSKDAGFNPALALALWIEETGASHTTLIRNGGSEIPVNGNVSLGHLGCAPKEDQTIDESLTCLFKFAANYTNDQFPQFMATYSGGPAGNPFANNPNFPKNIKNWYTKLVPSGNGAITPVTPNLGNFNIDVSALPTNYQQWAQEVLNTATSVAPKFKDLLNNKKPSVIPTDKSYNYTDGTTVKLKLGYDSTWFKQIFIHELGHVINGSYRPGTYGDQIKQAIRTDNGYLTKYSASASSGDEICRPNETPGNENTLADEDFAESVSYFINGSNMHELDYGCGVNDASVNPIYTTKYPAHLQLMKNILQ